MYAKLAPHLGGLDHRGSNIFSFMQTVDSENEKHIEQLMAEKHEYTQKLVCYNHIIPIILMQWAFILG